MSGTIFDCLGDRLVFSLDEAASLLGLHRQSLRSAIGRGEIHAVRVGRKWLIPRDSLVELLAGATNTRSAKAES